MKKLFLILLSLLFLSCSGISDVGKVMRNEKTITTDEFLVKKRKPLILPPDYNEIPEPGEISAKQKTEEDKIKKILKAPKEDNNSGAKERGSSVENSILKKIRK
mgnify:CR=1 FL=1